MRSKTLALVVALFSVVLLLCAGPASAAPADDAASTDPAQLFADAVERYDSKDFEGALPLFQQAYQATESPNARIYVARCLRELGRLPEAYDEMQATMREATVKAEAEAKYVPTRDSAAAELAMLEQRVGKLVITLTNRVDGTEVTLNGQALTDEQLGVPITVAPGLQTIIVTAPDRKRARHEVDLKGGRTRSIGVAPGAETAAPPPPKPPPPPPDREEPSGGLSGIQITGFVVAGVGVAAMGVMIATNVLADGKLAELEDACGDGPCTDPAHQDTIDEGKTYETVANVSLIAGAVLIVGGVAMIVFGGSSEPESETATLQVTPGVSPDGAYLGLHGRF